jgi:DNA replication ATP-dependent helicase Dna2
LLKTITLRQAWIESSCSPGSYVHIIGEFSSTGQCTIDNENNLLILHPDHLISATVVADSFGCTRRAVLQDRVKASSQSSPPMLYGTILHQVFQEAMMANQWDFEFLRKTIEQLLPRHFESLVDIGLNLNQAREHLFSKLPEMQAWAEIFVRAEPRVSLI